VGSNLCSGASGFLLPLSGGADSSSTAAIVGAMAQMAVRAAERGDQQVLADARRCTSFVFYRLSHFFSCSSALGFVVEQCRWCLCKIVGARQQAVICSQQQICTSKLLLQTPII
jgi:hypothetical protein